jgi:hypothetical protein
LLLLSSEKTLITELRVSSEVHSDSSSPQPFNNSRTPNNHKTDRCFLLLSFVGMLTTSYLARMIGQAGEVAAAQAEGEIPPPGDGLTPAWKSRSHEYGAG